MMSLITLLDILQSLEKFFLRTVSGQYILIFSFLGLIWWWSSYRYRKTDPLGEKAFYEHMNKYWDGEYEEEMNDRKKYD